jgi:spoIIIJ-associated protein
MFEDAKPLSAEAEGKTVDEAVAEGKTVDEAVRKALIATGWARDQVTIEVLDSGARSAWVSSSVARVRLHRKTGDAFALAKEVTAELLKRVGLEARIQVESRPDHIRVQVQGDNLEDVLLIEDGEPLDALQHLVSRIVSKQSASRQLVSVDLGGYRERRERELRDMAYRLADEVRETGEKILTDLLGAGERRVIHLALNEDPDITTFAIGDGLVKQIAIAPIDQAPPPEERRPADRFRGGRERRGGDRDRGRGEDRPRRERGHRDHGSGSDRGRGGGHGGRGGGRGGSGGRDRSGARGDRGRSGGGGRDRSGSSYGDRR